MYNHKTISAVLFVYNEQDFISETLDSIINQTVTVDEIIIVDDFSTDKTREIITSYNKKYPQIKYFLNDRKGKIFAYQNGLKKVTTDYFFVFGGDDVLMNNYVFEMFSLLDKNNVEYAYANYIMTDVKLNPIGFDKKKKYYTCKELINKNHVSGSIFGKSSIIKYLTPLPEDLLFEDWYTSIKLSSLFKYNYISQKPLVYYRRHPKSSTASYNTKEKYYYHLDRNIILFKAILKANFISDKKIIESIQYRISFLQTLRSYTFQKGLRSAFNKSLSFKERFKLLCFPLYFGIKYK